MKCSTSTFGCCPSEGVLVFTLLADEQADLEQGNILATARQWFDEIQIESTERGRSFYTLPPQLLPPGVGTLQNSVYTDFALDGCCWRHLAANVMAKAFSLGFHLTVHRG